MRRIICLFILFSFHGYAQESTKTDSKKTSSFSEFLKDTTRKRYFFFTLNAGMGVPFNEYGSTDTKSSLLLFNTYDSTHINGYAKLGFHANVTAGFFIVPHFAFVAKAGIDICSVQDSTLDYEQGLSLWYHFNGGFKIWQLMGGFYGSVQIYKGTCLWLQGMVGAIIANYPSFTAVSDAIAPSNQIETITCNISNSKGLGYCVSAGFENKINEGLAWTGAIGFTSSVISYPQLSYSYSGVYTYIHGQNTPATMSFFSLQVTLGIVAHL